MSHFQQVIDRYRTHSFSEADKGSRFERLMIAMLQTLPPYCDELCQVWPWREFPFRQSISKHDSGIDLVAMTTQGDYWAIQCKCYLADARIDKPDVDTFLTTSSRAFSDGEGNKHFFAQRLWIDTTDGGFTSTAADSFKNQIIPAAILHLQELAEMPLDWEELDRGISGAKAITERKELKPHQEEALAEAVKHYKDHDRGKLIMACGTGKTFTSLRIAEQLAGAKGKVLFLVPSIALMGQTLRAWCMDALHPLRPMCVCSDSEVSRSRDNGDDTNITSVVDLAWPASTSVEQIKHQFQALLHDKREGLLVVFSTYQSIERVAAAQRDVGEAMDFDFIICDEAHRTTGVTLKDEEESAFVRVHDNHFIHASKRMYMTATPRLYKDTDKQKAQEREAYLCSMDNAEQYGEEFYRLDFSHAVEKNLLSDYKVLILNVDEKDVTTEVQTALAGLDAASRREVDTDDMAKLIGCINALSKRSRYDNKLLTEIDPQPMHRAVAFCQNIKMSKAITAAFNACADSYYSSLSASEREGLVQVTARHVDGSMGAAQRDNLIGWLKRTPTDGTDCHILSNVRCLSEGVDVPSLDAAIFLSPKNSQVDVVQSVGRVMRTAPGKKYGYIIIPIVVPSDVDPEKALDDNQRYAVVWDILRALRAHDDRFNAMVNKLELNKRKPDTVQVVRPGSHLIGSGGNAESADSTGMVSEDEIRYQTQLEMRFEQLQNVIFARMVRKVGSKRYWEQWAADVAKIAERHIAQISSLVANDEKARKAFDSFLRGLHKDINPSVTEAAAVEMLAQHIITQPVFEALFENYAFADNNPVSKAMNKIVRVLNEKIDEKDHRSLEKFYDSVRTRAKGIDNAESKQKIVVELYDKFFSTAFPRVKEQLGIVYTPVEVVDFIIHSVEHVLREQFGRSMNDHDVKIIDPFTGTGTFITRLLQSGIIKPDNLEYKYRNEIFANEIVLLAYYIASVNIENTYHDLIAAAIEPTPEASYTPFPGICLTDTFELGEQMYSKLKPKQKEMEGMETPFVENSKRVQRQLNSPITVIIGNPPYSAKQKSANDNAQNQHYPLLEARIQKLYVEGSTATNNNSMYDSYIKAFRWASDKIESDCGIIAFITNAGWLDSNASAIFRNCLEKEFSDIYVLNLRGAIRSNMGNKEAAKREGGNIFGILTGVAITILVKNASANREKAHIHYYNMDDYLSAPDKLGMLRKGKDLLCFQFDTIHPNTHGDWINARNEAFSSYIPIEPEKKFDPKQKSIFVTYSCGVKTQRDPWCYNYSKEIVDNVSREMVDYYNSQRKKLCSGEIDGVDYETQKITWSAGVLNDIARNKVYSKEDGCIVVATYRPFSKQNLFSYPPLNERTYQIPRLFPTPRQKNQVICMSGNGVSTSFTCLISSIVPDLNIFTADQCFPLYWYEERKGTQGSLFDDGKDRYIRHDAVTDFILKRAREQYGPKVTKEDIFYYVYGFLHCPSYRETFANDLKKMLPRLPLVEKSEDFWAFSKAGRELADLHLNYEKIEAPKEVVIDWHNTLLHNVDTIPPEQLYRVEQMRFAKGASGGREKDMSTIEYNQFITLRNIPLRAYDYVVNGKSAIEWIMERYCDKVDKKSGIRNDANQWGIEHGNPRYPLDLLLSIITLSMKTLDIVADLPKMTFE